MDNSVFNNDKTFQKGIMITVDYWKGVSAHAARYFQIEDLLNKDAGDESVTEEINEAETELRRRRARLAPVALLHFLNLIVSIFSRVPVVGYAMLVLVACPLTSLIFVTASFCGDVFSTMTDTVYVGDLEDRRWLLVHRDIEIAGIVSAVETLRKEVDGIGQDTESGVRCVGGRLVGQDCCLCRQSCASSLTPLICTDLYVGTTLPQPRHLLPRWRRDILFIPHAYVRRGCLVPDLSMLQHLSAAVLQLHRGYGRVLHCFHWDGLLLHWAAAVGRLAYDVDLHGLLSTGMWQFNVVARLCLTGDLGTDRLCTHPDS
jgi:hypothetical protein